MISATRCTGLAFSAGVALIGSCAPAEDAHFFESVSTPAGAASSGPVLSAGADGRLRLAWTEALEEGGHALRFSVLEGAAWSPARTIARGEDWFVNWADVPALAAFADGTLVATWLEMLGEGTYAYGVRWARSSDGGATWKEAGFLHEDRSAGEHGFVSLRAQDAEHLRAVWLDGRATGGGHGAGHAGGHGGGQGAMQLYSRSLSRAGELGPEVVLDSRVCDCCPTALVTLTDGAALAAYRDRGEDELRDIALARIDASGSVGSAALHADGWIIDGCPVNGPLLAVSGQRVAAAWFTRGGDDRSRVLVALSADGGASFAAPVELAAGGVLGQLAGTFDAGGVLRVTWLASDVGSADGQAWWMLGSLARDGRVLEPARGLVPSLPARVAGIARLAEQDGQLWFAWSEVDESGATRVRTARVTPEGS